jgi:hypothetical protein
MVSASDIAAQHRWLVYPRKKTARHANMPGRENRSVSPKGRTTIDQSV